MLNIMRNGSHLLFSRNRSVSLALPDRPLRAELYTVQQLEQHARTLAKSHETDVRGGRNELLIRLRENEKLLRQTYELIREAAAQKRRITPASEWMLDNFYLVEEHIRTTRRHLPRGYSRELPRLSAGAAAGYPRVYALALELISHVDGKIDHSNISHFVSAYQSVSELNIGELWAVPIMLRLALIENLRRVAVRIASGQADRDSARAWASRLISTMERSPAEVIMVVADLARARLKFSSSFVAELCRHLQGQNQNFSATMSWLDLHLSEQGLSREQMIIDESQNQAYDQVSIGNSIGSLRTLDAIDWREFVESSSNIEHILRSDPAGVYPQMDFSTRDRYRHVVEMIARRGTLREADVAQTAIECALKGVSTPEEYKKHVGYYLVDEGFAELRRATRSDRGLVNNLSKLARENTLLIYLGAVLVLSVWFSILASKLLWGLNPWIAAPLGIVMAFTSTQFALTLVNWLMSVYVNPRRLPKLDFSKGIPAEYHTVVAVPTMLASAENVANMIEKMEVRYLGNRDRALHFALLSDFRDANTEKVQGDEELVAVATSAVAALNQKYATDGEDIFFLFHRPRLWNPHEKLWMGYERKRGKLAEFNRFLLRGDRGAFSHIAGNADVLKNVKYVITLDSDTQLPRDSARQLAAAMAHPLNRPVFNQELGRVTRGYSILQPSVAISLPSTQRSWFASLFSGEPGIDPYTHVISDVYQDLFDEGSFVGKGIYDLHSFEQVMSGRLPENRILSHDLLEGCFVRGGFASDILVFEEFPSSYLADSSRRHRWIRGDWQILRWLMPYVPTLNAARVHNSLSVLSRWKILDNLRRCLIPVAALITFIGGWLLLPSPGEWTLFVSLVFFLPLMLDVLGQAIGLPQTISFSQQMRILSDKLMMGFARTLLNISFLPHEACVSIDASVRTLYRLSISHRRLLEWTTASECEQSISTTAWGVSRAMASGPVLAIALFVTLSMIHPTALLVAGPFLFMWFVSPAAAFLCSQPIKKKQPKLSSEDIRFLRRTARKTWSFFERLVNSDENWLPPDNIQEYPIVVVAHRTSPTNFGISLLANLSAYDLGYISVLQLLSRTASSLSNMQKLERFRGHFYNWYDTINMKPLMPLYISTVDSGNLAGHLLTLRRGLLELEVLPVLSPRAFAGMNDTLDVLHELIDARHGDSTVNPRIHGDMSHMRALLRENVNGSTAARLQLLNEVCGAAKRLLEVPDIALDSELKTWTQALLTQAEEVRNNISAFMPWLSATIDSSSRAGFQWPSDKLKNASALILAESVPSLEKLDDLCRAALPELDEYIALLNVQGTPNTQWQSLRELVASASMKCAAVRNEIERLSEICHDLSCMDFGFLYDPLKKLFSIGFNVADHRLDGSCYDLLASEARLVSFLAVAQGQVPQEHWFALGRQVTGSGGAPTLVSWSGSMFEYLMPLLVMPNYANTLLDQTYRGTVQRQIDYGRQNGVPWGISESGYNLTDAQLNYQYRAFGVPGLGLKRGLSEDLVVAPYASVMAVMVAPNEACQNLRRLAREGRTGTYGFYEAVDYTPTRIPRGQHSAAVRSFMAHHEGMSLLALDYFLADCPMQRRFHAEPLFKVADLLLHERVPKSVAPVLANAAESAQNRLVDAGNSGALRVVRDPNHPVPDVHLLSNGRYHVIINAAGSGSSRWKDLSLTRWREDAMCDNYGIFCYIRELDTGEVWSNSYQPTLKKTASYEAIFSQGRAEFRRSDHEIDIHTEISVSAEDDVEVRRMSITNRSNRIRNLELTSYGEVVIATAAADAAHPAFSNLFVQSQLYPERNAIVCTRRPRQAGEQMPFLLHAMCVRGHAVGTTMFETDRSAFIGRGNTVANPAVLAGARLTGAQGSVLDPIISIRRNVMLEPLQTVLVDMVCGVAESNEQASILIDKYSEQPLADRVFEMAWTHSQVALRQLNATEADAQFYGRLAGSIVYSSRHRRAGAAILAKNRRGQSGLWAYGISGDLPIVMVRISDGAKIELVRQIVQAHAYWRMKGLIVDLVITNDDSSVYRQALYDQIMQMIAAGGQAQMLDKPGGIFVRRAEQISDEDRILLQTIARVVLSDGDGTLQEQAERRIQSESMAPKLKVSVAKRPVLRLDTDENPAPSIRESSLQFFNGLGGFSQDGKEYCILLQNHRTTPAPWVNVLANPYFGTVISESGGGYTWLENSHEYRLTPWRNDSVCDTPGEAFYLRDEDNGAFWSPAPLPVRVASPYVIRHGFGYSSFECSQAGISSELLEYVAIDAPVKFMRVTLRNHSRRSRRLSLFGYFEWVLGDLRTKTQMHVFTETDPMTGAFLARNPFSNEFPGRVAFVAVTDRNNAFTGDRGEFIGRNRTLADPAALHALRLSGKTGAGLDPCSALQIPVNLAPGQDYEVVFLLGMGRDNDDMRLLLERFCNLDGASLALNQVKDFWQNTLGTIEVSTPDRGMDILANGWLLYQTLSCRMWGRTGFYQSGGAFGFRDQLQDSMALVHAQPALAREHLLRAARHQFKEGDVQHWWHPPSGRGVRTHFSDDYLWLPYAACRYVKVTGDAAVLGEPVQFIEGRTVNADEEAYYDLPMPSEETATLYMHCVRAIERGLKFGEHGLPLIGCGDWNDGMNRIGEKGRGESVWLAFFLFDVLRQFSEIAKARGDQSFAQKCLQQSAQLQSNIEANAWDGDWYRRAYFDDGTPLGSAQNQECQIDALPQSWAILSEAGDAARSAKAMDAVDQRLVRRKNKLIQLFDPPFNGLSKDPGYIQGYVPGVRENGGQYTHAAIWTIMAFAKMGNCRRAFELFSLINPINHASRAGAIAVYKVEPYVVAADVYAVPPHVGRGGWTWYSGSAGWMYRLIVESLLGLRIENGRLILKPCVPPDWNEYKIKYKHGDSCYELTVKRGDSNQTWRIYLDGVEQSDESLRLIDDGRTHQVVIAE